MTSIGLLVKLIHFLLPSYTCGSCFSRRRRHRHQNAILYDWNLRNCKHFFSVFKIQ